MAQSQPDSGWIYQCEDIVVEPRAHRLERAGVVLSVEPKAYAVLVVLLQQAGEVVSKDVLLDAAWGHRHVTPGVLTRVISQLRHTLGDRAGHPRYIATVHSLGYRFIGDVQRMEAPAVSTGQAANDEFVTGRGPDDYADTAAFAAPEKPPARRKAPGQWLAAAITLIVIVAMLAVASLVHPPSNPSHFPRTSPQPALVVLPFAHSNSAHVVRPRHWPRNRRVATLYPNAQGGETAFTGAAGYLRTSAERGLASSE